MTTTQSITSGQEKQITRFGADAVERALEELGLDKSGAQKVIERGDDFGSAIQKAALAAIREFSVSNQFANEEVNSSYNYPSGYKVKGITEQTNILRATFPGVGFADEKLAERSLPKGAEGWFAIPRWQSMAPTYGEAVEKVLAAIKSKRTLYNYREGKLTERYLRQLAKTEKAFQKLGNEQKGYDILVVAAQFGLRHRGRSVRRAREVMNASEFGLGAFAVGIMLLTHPERLVQWEQLHVDCAGDEYDLGAGGGWNGAPIFGFDDGEVMFVTLWFDFARGHYGSASGFLPQ